MLAHKVLWVICVAQIVIVIIPMTSCCLVDVGVKVWTPSSRHKRNDRNKIIYRLRHTRTAYNKNIPALSEAMITDDWRNDPGFYTKRSKRSQNIIHLLRV